MVRPGRGLLEYLRGGYDVRILITSIVDLMRSQHNRPHHFVRYLSKKHDVTVLSINDWWKRRQDDLESYSSEFDDVFKRIGYFYLTEKKVSPILQELFFRKKVKEILKEEEFLQNRAYFFSEKQQYHRTKEK